MAGAAFHGAGLASHADYDPGDILLRNLPGGAGSPGLPGVPGARPGVRAFYFFAQPSAAAASSSAGTP
jgi:hypothetical protein